MERELKRVPMDFKYPLNQVWSGYLNPYPKGLECPDCEGGYSEDYRRLQALWYSHLGGGFRPEMRGSTPYLPTDDLVVEIVRAKIKQSPQHYTGPMDLAIPQEAVRLCQIWNSSWSHHLNEQDVAALLEADRLLDFTHTFKSEEGWVPKSEPCIPSPKQVNDWSLAGFGHDSINCCLVLKAELKRFGLPHACSTCDGSGLVWDSEKAQRDYDEWKPSEPPEGEGYQLWGNTSTGSPVSPVFDNLVDLCLWCEQWCTTFGLEKATASKWHEMLVRGVVEHQVGNVTFI